MSQESHHESQESHGKSHDEDIDACHTLLARAHDAQNELAAMPPTLDDCVALGADQARTHGALPPLLFAQDEQMVRLHVLRAFPADVDARQIVMRSLGTQEALVPGFGPLRRLIWLAEAWLQVIDHPAPVESVDSLESTEPQESLEVVVAVELTLSPWFTPLRARCQVARLRRAPTGALCAVEPLDEQTQQIRQVCSPTLEAFLAGYREARTRLQ